MRCVRRLLSLKIDRRRFALRIGSATGLLPLVALSQPVPGPVNDGGVIEQVIVTAQKTEEDLFHIPLSVQALPGDFLDATDVSSLFELQFDVPGLVVTSAGGFGAGLALRGASGVASHYNGIYLGSSQLTLVRLFDIERVEVLKGAQGTLYGRNTTGGSINFISRVAEPEFSAAVESAAGSFGTTRVLGHINVPAAKIAGRIAIVGSDGEGFIRNSIDDRRFSEEDYFGIRGSFHATPTHRLTLDLTAQRAHDDGASGELWLPRVDQLVNPRDIHLTTVSHPNPYLIMTDNIVSLDINYGLEKASVRSITGYTDSATRNLDDCAGIPALQGCVRALQPTTYRQSSQEFHFKAPAGAAMDWLAGILVVEGDDLTNYHFRLPVAGPGPINDYSAMSKEAVHAAFGQVTAWLTERWSFTGGLRLSHESMRVASVGTGSADNPEPAAVRGSWSNESWRIGAEYAFTEHSMLYASVATAYNSGGVTTELLPNGQFDDYDPESMTAFEIGAKFKAPGRRWSLLASVFLYDFEDLQVRTTAILADRVTSVVDNAAAARVHGVDIDVDYRFGDRLNLSGALIWLPRREFVEFVTVSGDTLAGNDLSRAPEWTAALSLSYLLAGRRHGDLFARVHYNYRSRFFFTGENSPLSVQDSFGLVDVFLEYRTRDGKWRLFASARNLLDTSYFTHMVFQSSPGPPANYELGFGRLFESRN